MKTSVGRAVWQGNLKKGKGRLKLNSIGFETDYNYLSRFENGKDTTPEELIGAAHAGCFSMYLANVLDQKGYKPSEVVTEGHVSLDNNASGPYISGITLHTTAKVDNIDEETFLDIAEDAKKNCVVSKALAAVKIEMKAKLLHTIDNPA